MLPVLHADFSRGKSGGLVFPSWRIFHSLLWSTQSKALSSQQSRSRCLSWTLFLFWWFNGCWQFNLWFLCLFKPCLPQWNHKPCHVGPPKMDRSLWSVLTKRGPLEKIMENHFSIIALKLHEQYEKLKRYDTERWAPQVGRCPKCYWRRAEK